MPMGEQWNWVPCLCTLFWDSTGDTYEVTKTVIHWIRYPQDSTHAQWDAQKNVNKVSTMGWDGI